MRTTGLGHVAVALTKNKQLSTRRMGRRCTATRSSPCRGASVARCINMYICECIVYIYIYIYAYIYVYICNIYMYIYVHVWYIFLYTCICMYIHMYIYISSYEHATYSYRIMQAIWQSRGITFFGTSDTCNVTFDFPIGSVWKENVCWTGISVPTSRHGFWVDQRILFFLMFTWRVYLYISLHLFYSCFSAPNIWLLVLLLIAWLFGLVVWNPRMPSGNCHSEASPEFPSTRYIISTWVTVIRLSQIFPMFGFNYPICLFHLSAF